MIYDITADPMTDYLDGLTLIHAIQRPGRVRFYGRDVMFASMTGSHNYNLHEEGSDEDWKVFVLPNFNDIYDAKVFTKSTTGTEMDCTIYDIRRLPELTWKANPNMLEVLFSDDIRVPDVEYGDWVEEILGMRDDIARMNLPYLFMAGMGIVYDEIKSLDKKRSGNIEEFGYDTKTAMHAYRTLENIELFGESDFEDFGSIVHCDRDRRDKLLAIKHGEFYKDLNHARRHLEEFKAKVERWKPCYWEQDINPQTYIHLKNLCRDVFYEHLFRDTKDERATSTENVQVREEVQ